MLEAGFTRNKLYPLSLPNETEFTEKQINIIYLYLLLKDWSLVNNAEHSCLNGLQIRMTPKKLLVIYLVLHL